MGIFDDLGKAVRKVEDDMKKTGPGTQGRNGAQELNPEKTLPAPPAALPAKATPARASHPGYAKIALWMKNKYKGRIPPAGDPFQRTLALEQLSAEASSGLSAKTKKGFLAYLKAQNYEQLLK